MATLLFDKMQAARRLETEGRFTREQAEILAEVYHDAMTQAVATKSDLETGIQALRADLNLAEGKLHTEMLLLEARMLAAIAESSTRTIVTLLGFMVPLLIASGMLQHFWK